MPSQPNLQTEKPTVNPQFSPPAPNSPKPQWYLQPFWIIVLTLTILGPFALGLVWRTPLMTPKQKWILGTIIVILTIIQIWVAIWIIILVWRYVTELNSMLNDINY